MTTSPDFNRRSRPTSAPSHDSTPSSSMTRSSSADQNKVSKRKGTRSVSTLTPAQLARKRANDREAQRAIRARTKEHIERLESELDELRGQHSRDKTVQELLRRNKALEEELRRLRDTVGVSMTSSPYSTPVVYDDNLSTGSGPIPSPRTSPFPASDFAPSSLPDYPPAYVPFPGNTEAWAATVTTSVPSTVSSPTSSATPDEYVAPYLPTSAPMMSSPTSNGLRGGHEIKMEYEDGNDHGFRLDSRSNASGTPPISALGPPAFVHPHQQAPWNMYAMYYHPVQSPVH